MCMDELMQLEGQIQMLGLPKEQEEVLMVQAADLVRFKECFAGELQFIDPFSYKVSIVASETNRAGICFLAQENTKSLQQVLYETNRFKRLKRVQQIWFVFVAGPGEACRQNLGRLIAQHNIKQLCSKVFLLNYFDATLHIL